MLSTLVNRAVLAFLAATLGIVSVMLFQINRIELTSLFTLFDLLGFIGLLAGSTLMMRVAIEVLSEPRGR